MKAHQFAESELPIDNGRVYHLQLAPGELADSVLIVGDPDRVPLLAKEFFAEVDADVCHRGLRTMTGITKAHNGRLTIATSGMGTPSLEIVLQELAILNEIDLRERTRKESFSPLKIIRVGTSGALQTHTPLGTAVITTFALGIEASGVFYECPASVEAAELEKLVDEALAAAIEAGSRFAGKIKPYVSEADDGLVKKLEAAAARVKLPFKRGLTASNSGFFANQGRDVCRIKPVVPAIDALLAGLLFRGLRFENMEMEASFLLHFCKGLNYPAAAICPTVANRRLGTFLMNYQDAVVQAGQAALDALIGMQS